MIVTAPVATKTMNGHVSVGSQTGSGFGSRIQFFKTGTSINKVDLATIDYIQAYGNYSKIVMRDKQLTISLPLKEVENYLTAREFVRIHRSCVVAVKKIEKIKDHIAYVNDITLPIGKLYREAFYELIFRI